VKNRFPKFAASKRNVHRYSWEGAHLMFPPQRCVRLLRIIFYGYSLNSFRKRQGWARFTYSRVFAIKTPQLMTAIMVLMTASVVHVTNLTPGSGSTLVGRMVKTPS
jgi:hypothetical protein